uniref:Reverse transcriptase domain-containing protein n=1 Tax=Tanacetum cinerariifolium TaxID=118510 RepID=A0A699IX00_TANCI|nr:reverse transcriptase domain-containing protein [Tanacetum cinerariifolium]
MSTRSSTRNLFPPLDNPELTIQRRSHADPTLLNDFEMAAEGNGDPPVPDLRTMKELCQPSLNGRGGPIAPIAIQAANFGLKNDMIQQVQNSCQFHGLSGDDANKHLDKFLHVTQSIKVDGVTDDALHLYLFPHSLTHHATAWFVRRTFMKRRPKECYDLIKNMTAHHNDWDTSVQRNESSSSITSSFDPEIVALKAEMAEINTNIMRVLQVNQQMKAVTPSYETCGGPHSYNDFPATVGQTQNVYAAGAYQGNTIANPKEDLKGITTRSRTAYQGPTIPTVFSSLPKVVECESKVTKDTVPPTNNESTKDVQPSVVQIETSIPNSEPVVAPVSALKPNQKPSIPYPDFLLEEVDAFLALEDDPTSWEVDHFYYDPEGDILLLEAFVNDDPSLPPPTQGNYLPQVQKELKTCEAKNDKSSIDEPSEVELKDLPPHLEYTFLEGDDKFPFLIAKDLSVEERATLIKVLKSHKRAIAWKLFDIKGINSEFCTHKILMEDEFEPAVQYQRRVNPKIYDVIKKMVLKLLDAGLIYLISDSPWVSPVHCVLKKGGFTIVENEENELIPTRLVMGWRVCIDCRKLNEATCKDHFPLPFMDQMLERLAGNEYYYLLDGFSSYF